MSDFALDVVDFRAVAPVDDCEVRLCFAAVVILFALVLVDLLGEVAVDFFKVDFFDPLDFFVERLEASFPSVVLPFRFCVLLLGLVTALPDFALVREVDFFVDGLPDFFAGVLFRVLFVEVDSFFFALSSTFSGRPLCDVEANSSSCSSDMSVTVLLPARFLANSAPMNFCCALDVAGISFPPCALLSPFTAASCLGAGNQDAVECITKLPHSRATVLYSV